MRTDTSLNFKRAFALQDSYDEKNSVTYRWDIVKKTDFSEIK